MITPVRKFVALATTWSASVMTPLRVVGLDKRLIPARIQLRSEGAAVMPSSTVLAESVAELEFCVEFEILNAHLFLEFLQVDF